MRLGNDVAKALEINSQSMCWRTQLSLMRQSRDSTGVKLER